MPIYELTQSGIVALSCATFNSINLQERRDLQRLLRENVQVISPDTLVISEEFGEWEDSRRRIDLLGLDRDANLVVIELKRTEDGGHMELQAIRYASMVSTMTFDRAVEVFAQFLKANGKVSDNPREVVLDFLGWDAPDEDKFFQDVRIVLASAEFSREITSSVLWLNSHGLDIRCVRLKPYSFDARILVDVQQIIPLPEEAEFQVQIRETEVRKEREARTAGNDRTLYDIEINGAKHASMPKKRAIFEICKHLCGKSISPEDIASHLTWRRNRLWYSVDGVVDAADFETRAAEKARSVGRSFDRTRWFCKSGDLIHVNCRTYALSDQWTAQDWHKAMTALKDAYPQYNIDFTPTK